ncbi:hypothetical protein EXN66_Car003949 [Channa argus]|uniref:Immunoglobulin domain-containing protein n=1 Tax=Channa argus TaxID=215402 RepID=A0A6G1PDF8_CHAAH|nr:hypothetical protein EXN66_Car003949 [Channa argus]
MDLLWMILLVFLVCAEAQNVTEVKVELGQNVTLNCSGDNVDVYWYVEIVSQVRGHISRTFRGDPADTEYFVSSVISKYSAWENSLLITNITAEDCRLYFCGRRINGDIQFVDTFSLVSENNNDQQHDVMCQNKVVICSSYVLNVFLLLGLLCSLIWLKKKKNCSRQVTHPSPNNTGTLDSQQYAEIQFPPVRAPPPAASSECIYSKVKLPHSTHPGR